MIPKTIHYCWFGNNPLPDLAVKCIASWEKYFPGYIITRWDENNFDVNCCTYVREAYAAGKWAFVSDYARFWILYHKGGLYFDTDVEVIKPFDDILAKGAFMGCEAIDKCAPGLGLGANPGLGLYKEMLDLYEKMHFLDIRGNADKTTVVNHMTELLKKKGFCGDGDIECIEEITVYPPEYFCPMRYDTGEITITENTHSIHHFSESWLSKEERRVHKVEQFLKRKFGYRLSRCYTFPYRVKWKIEKLGLKEAFMFAIEKLERRFMP